MSITTSSTTTTNRSVRITTRPAQLPWFQQRRWQNYLQDRIARRTRRRYALHLSERAPLGATDPKNRVIYVNPTQLEYPDADRQAIIRNIVQDPDEWEQEITVDLIEHECGHVNHTGDKPEEKALGSLWNGLEDERQERLQVLKHPANRARFERLGDTAWSKGEPTGRLLDWCLLWRWEFDHPASWRQHSRLDFTQGDWQLWELAVRPLVEQAWVAQDSDEVLEIAKRILEILDEDPDGEPSAVAWCSAGGGRPDEPDENPATAAAAGEPIEATPEDDSDLPAMPGKGVDDAESPLGQYEAEPYAILNEIEVPAQELAKVLTPTVQNVRTVPSASRGELVLERAMVRSIRPFDHQTRPGQARSLVILELVDESGSMGHGWRLGSNAYGAVRGTMMLNRACELSHTPLQVWGYEASPEPRIIQSYDASVGPLTARRRIAGIDGRGSTFLSTVFGKAVDALRVRPEDVKWLLLAIDGQLMPSDAVAVSQHLRRAEQYGIHVQPFFIGDDPASVEKIKLLFGRCLVAPDPINMAKRMEAWIRATR